MLSRNSATLDLGPRFERESNHLPSLLSRRDEFNARRIPFGNDYLDDCLGGVYPDDLILIGAATGVGKTALAVNIAWSAAQRALDPVYLFALEAEAGEVAARIAFGALSGRSGKSYDFGGWWRGRYKDLDAYWPQVQVEIETQLGRIRTLYKRKGDFTNHNLSQQLEEIPTDAKLVIVDHLHVVDSEQFSNPNSTQHKTVRMLRDFALDRSIPVVAISHLRKKQSAERQNLMPSIDDLHGTSELSKIATGVILVARDWDTPLDAGRSSTFVQVAKDRRGRANGMVARLDFNTYGGFYLPGYSLGHIRWEDRKQGFVAVDRKYLPRWAEHEACERPF